MPSNATQWYDFLLQQMAAESYLEGLTSFERSTELESALRRGNNRTDDGGLLRGLTRMSAPQVDEFLTRFRIIHQWSDDPKRNGNPAPGTPGYLSLAGQQILANTGLSATLIRNVDPSSPDFGKLTLSIRSSEYAPVADGGDRERDILGADARAIAFDGFALAQLDALDKYVAWLDAQGMIAGGEAFNVTGYSLGGHLATLYTELHPERVLHAYTFNGAGRGEWDHSKGDIGSMLEFYRAVLANPDAAATLATDETDQAMLAAARLDGNLDPVSIYNEPRYEWAQHATRLRFGLTGNASFLPPSDPARTGLTNGAAALISQLYGHGGSGDVEVVTNSGVHGPATAIFIEDQPLLQGLFPGGVPFDFGNTHSLTLLADSLALLRVLGTLDPSATLPVITRILAGASAQKVTNLGDYTWAEGDSLEQVVVALGQLLGIELELMPVDRIGAGFANIRNRDAFHENLQRIGASLGDTGFRLTGVPDLVPEQLASLAKSEAGLAYRYALAALNPFVLSDDSGRLYQRFGRGQPRHDELDYSYRSHDVTLTDDWIVDRSRMLVAAVQANLDDHADPGGHLIGPTGNAMYIAYDLNIGPVVVESGGIDGDDLQLVIFGNEASNQYMGGSQGDHLYGGGGNDVLKGLDGDDLLEGGADADELHGGGGMDRLFGGKGNDELFGDGDKDRLEGGVGNDRLRGGEADDILFGSEGDDTLDGGAGNDRMEGGVGFDTYQCSLQEGSDTILDLDGYGRLMVDGVAWQAPKGGYLKFGDGWIVTGSSLCYLAFSGDLSTGGTLTISGEGNGDVRLENFRNGDLGISLSTTEAGQVGWPAMPSQTWQAKSQIQAGSGESDYAISVDEVAVFFGASGDDILEGRSDQSDSAVSYFGGSGNDLLIGGANAVGGYSGDMLVGGGGQDILLGNGGNDSLIGDGFGNFYSDYFIVDSFMYQAPDVGDDVGRYYFNGNTVEKYQYHFGSDFEAAMRWITGLQGSEAAPEFYDDRLEGGEGDDALTGMAGSDNLFGNSGNDRLEGDGLSLYLQSPSDFSYLIPFLGSYGDDYLNGGDGDDELSDLVAGSDTLIGGEGNDILKNEERASGAQNNSLYLAGFLNGNEVFNNLLDGGGGDDRIRSQNSYAGSHDILLGGSGDDVIEAYGLGASFEIEDGDGNDMVRMAYSKYSIVSGEGSDTYEILVEGLGDFLIPGLPLVEEAFRTIHFRNRGGDTQDIDTVLVNLYAPISNVSWWRQDNDLLVSLGVRSDWMRFEDWFLGQEWKMDKVAITEMAQDFSTVGVHEWTSEQIDRMAVWKGTPYADLLVGADYGQTILGGQGDDILVSGSGDDVLNGGQGNDAYRFGMAFGTDVIEASAEGRDAVQFLPGVAANHVTPTKSGDDLVLTASQAGGSLTIRSWFSGTTGGVSEFRFDDGTRWTRADIAGRLGLNHAPVAIGELDDVALPSGQPFSVQFEEGLFSDADPGDSIHYEIGTRAGALLPGWLEFDADTRVLHGIAPPAPGVVELFLYGVDVFGAWAALPFDLDLSGRVPGLIRLGTGASEFLAGSPGNDMLDGGAGNDTLSGGAGADFFIGGTGDDQIVTGGGHDLIAFNRGDGRDTVTGGPDSSATLSLGRGVWVDDLQFSKSSKDLILRVGNADQITFRDWYAQGKDPSVTRLQFVAEHLLAPLAAIEGQAHRIETFDFTALAAAFDAGGQVSGWALTEALLDAHLAGSDTEALGGDLAYRYGLSGHLDGLNAGSIGAALGNEAFGQETQAISPAASIAVTGSLSRYFSGLHLP